MTAQRWPVATRDDLERFCQTEGWSRTKTARGGRSTHHVTYELDLPDGATLRTRISRPVDRTDYGPRQWSHSLRDQLQVTEGEFWACRRDGVRPLRGRPEPTAEALPAELVHLLVHTVRVSEVDLRGMTRQQAVDRLNRYWTEER